MPQSQLVRITPGSRRSASTGLLALVVTIGLLVGPGVERSDADVFPDVAFSHPFAVPIDWAVFTGITTGYADGTFRPTDGVTRQAFSAFLYRYSFPAAANPACAQGAGPFTDVSSDHPFCGEIAWMADSGIAGGYDDGSYRPAQPISRQAMAAFLYRYQEGAAEPPTCTAGADPFADVSSGHPFCGEIEWMVTSGVASGYNDGTFRPAATISRQAAAAFLWRLRSEPWVHTEVGSRANNGSLGNGNSESGDISDDGRYVAFSSIATNLVAGDSNAMRDVFVHDRVTGTTERVSVDSDGTQANGASDFPSLSADGRYVAFQSDATNLSGVDNNDASDIFLRDRQTNTTTRLTRRRGATGAPDGASTRPAISADGRFVAFTSDATNMTIGDDNALTDVFVVNAETLSTIRVSVPAGGGESNGTSGGADISADGRFVAFSSLATNLVPGDTNGASDVFVRDRTASTTERVSVSSAGAQANGDSESPSISGDGRFVAFGSTGASLAPGPSSFNQVYVRDRAASTTERVSINADGQAADTSALAPSITDDGRFVAFDSTATNLVANDTNAMSDVFVRDRSAATTQRLSVRLPTTEGNGNSRGATLTPDGRYVVYQSLAANLIVGDSNGSSDVFVGNRFGVGG